MTEFTSDPDVLRAAVQKAQEEPEKQDVKTVAPSSTDVLLPGGFISGDGSVVKYAEVRELNGADEEAVSRAGSPGKALLTMLQRGVVSIGGNPVEKGDLEKMLSGDRDSLLIAIRRATFGDTVDFGLNCPSCNEELVVTVDLTKDIPYVTLDDPINGRKFTYESKKGTIVVSLPNGYVQKQLLENTDKTRAEMNTILLAGCVDSVNGVAATGNSTVLKLGMADRDAIVTEVLTKNPGPRLGEVKTTCEACSADIPMPLSLADLFRL